MVATLIGLVAGGVAWVVAAPTAGAASPKPLTILVTNDDGYNSPGINTLVQALRKLPQVKVLVVAPATNESGTGAKTTPGTLVTSKVKTLSGYPAVAVQGYPADTVRAALDQLHIRPTLVVSGINLGQNLGPVVDLSGTVGAARAAAVRGIPAVATSQGLGSPVAYPVTAKAAVTWITAHRSKLTVTKTAKSTIVNINGPSCGTTGSPRGTVNAPPAPGGNALGTSDCSSTATNPPDDVTALTDGFIVVDTIPATPAAPTS
ncbi:MAG TPA: 5'/3'-nucleotidase SurE [Acidimicrobiales bacterium]|nr:5'/3'-nucleotidase SurE [Acidimicrobiales bacterium]